MRIEDVVDLLRCRRIGVIDESLAPDRKRQHHRAVAALGGNLIEQRHIMRRYQVVEALAIVRDEGVPVDQAADAVGNLVGDTSDYHAAIAVTHKDDVIQIFLGQIIYDRLDRFLQADGFGIARLVAGDRRRVDLVAGCADRSRGRLKFGAGMPSAVDEHISRHVAFLPFLVLVSNGPFSRHHHNQGRQAEPHAT